MAEPSGAQPTSSQGTPRNPAAHLAPYAWPRGVSGNPSGGKPRHRLLDAVLAELDANPDLAQMIAQKWLGLVLEGNVEALRELVLRVDGRVPQGEQRTLPAISVLVQHLTGIAPQATNGHAPTPAHPSGGPPVTPRNGQSQVVLPPMNGNGKAHVVEVEAVPCDVTETEDSAEDSEDSTEDSE